METRGSQHAEELMRCLREAGYTFDRVL
jgi:hypothetical protein